MIKTNLSQVIDTPENIYTIFQNTLFKEFTSEFFFKENRVLPEGIYSITKGTAIFDVPSDGLRSTHGHIKKFIETYPKFVIAHGDNTNTLFMLSKRPKEPQGLQKVGSGFDSGSTNTLKNCPQNLLIIANSF